MTVSTNRGRGGKRPVAGRPKSKGVVAKVIAEKTGSVGKDLDEAITSVLSKLDDGDYPTSAAELEGLALATLKQIMRAGPQDGPRVSAAKAVKEWADAERERDAESRGITGKKAAAQATAEAKIAAGGKFEAPPPPPGTRMQ